jgi:hypothetical protein
LGVRGGESTFVFQRVARRCGAALVSVDIASCSGLPEYDNWFFVQADDVVFGNRFGSWCREVGLPDAIDVLFVDTSHLYDHTVAEIRTWVPHLASLGAMIFHDTNLKGIYRRRDWSLGQAWDNGRGVIRALEAFLGVPLNEHDRFESDIGQWHVTHDPICNGLTVLRRQAEK